jgi:hypothetical protein
MRERVRVPEASLWEKYKDISEVMSSTILRR